MIAGVGLCDGSVLAALLPVKLTRVNDNAAERCAVTADELCCRVYYNVRTVLYRTDKVRSTECVVYYERKSVLVSDLCDSVNVGDIAVGVAECFKVDSLCVILNCVLNFFKVVRVYKCSADAILGKRMCKQDAVASAATPPSSAAILVSKAPCVEFVSLPYILPASARPKRAAACALFLKTYDVV